MTSYRDVKMFYNLYSRQSLSLAGQLGTRAACRPCKCWLFLTPASCLKSRSDTAGEFWSGGEGGEARSAGRGAWGRPEPVPETTEVDSGRRRDVLQVNLGQPTIARPAQPEGAHALRDGALDPGRRA